MAAGQHMTFAVINIGNRRVFVRHGYPHMERSEILGDQPPKFRMPGQNELEEYNFGKIIRLYGRYGWTQRRNSSSGHGDGQLRPPVYDVAVYKVVEVTQTQQKGTGDAKWQLSRNVCRFSSGETIFITDATRGNMGRPAALNDYQQGLGAITRFYADLLATHGLSFFRQSGDTDSD